MISYSNSISLSILVSIVNSNQPSYHAHIAGLTVESKIDCGEVAATVSGEIESPV
jgi:hypothetical protein